MVKYLEGKECRIIALCMDDSGMPKSVDYVVGRAVSLVGELEKVGFKRDDIFIDPLIQPMSVDVNNGKMAMDSVRTIMSDLKGVHTTGGLSNISYGLPERRITNRTFLSMMMANGFDSAIMDPLDKDIMALHQPKNSPKFLLTVLLESFPTARFFCFCMILSSTTHFRWQIRGHFWKHYEQSDHNKYCKEKGNYTTKYCLYFDVFCNSSNSKDVKAEWRCDQPSLHHQHSYNSEPYGVIVKSCHHWENNRHGEYHHGDGIEETTEKKIDKDNSKQNYTRGNIKTGDPTCCLHRDGGKSQEVCEYTCSCHQKENHH